jgi:hypothetical protein
LVFRCIHVDAHLFRYLLGSKVAEELGLCRHL